MDNIKINSERFTPEELLRIDARIKLAMSDWRVESLTPDGVLVDIPGTWNAEVYPYRYFEVYKEPDDPNPGEAENEIQCYLSCGWRGMDDEVQIVLTILGADVLSGANRVVAEIYKFGAYPMKVFRREQLVTDFTEKFWWFFRRDINKVVWQVK
jgi:hypothetical protein